MQFDRFQFNDGKCIGNYLINPTGTLYCDRRKLLQHLLAEGEDAFDYNLRQAPKVPGQKIIKVDLPQGVYIVQYSHPSFLQGLVDVLQRAGYNVEENIRG